MTDYDVSWLAAVQHQRRKEGSTKQNPKEYYFIMDYATVEVPYDQAFAVDEDDSRIGNGIAVLKWDREFFPDTFNGRTELLKALHADGYDTKYDTDRNYITYFTEEEYPTEEDSIEYIANFFDLEYEFSSRVWVEQPRMGLLFLTRTEAEKFLERYPHVCETPQKAFVTSTNTYRTSTMGKLLHFIDTIDLERSTIVVKDDTA